MSKNWPIGGYQQREFTTPSRFLKWISRYHFQSEELQDLVQTQGQKIHSMLVDLSVARDRTNPLIINEPARAIVIYGVTTSSAYDPEANTGIETVANTAMMACWFDDDRRNAENLYVLKHGRGYRGDFRQVTLMWPAQSNVSARIHIYHFNDIPWVSGDFPA